MVDLRNISRAGGGGGGGGDGTQVQRGGWSFCKSRVLLKRGISVISLCSIVLYSAIFYVVYLYHYVLRQSK